MSVSPQAPSHSSARVLKCMRRRERRAMVQTMLLAAAALPGMLVDALFLSWIVWLLGPIQHHIPWLTVFWCCVPGAVPLFWWIDRHTAASDPSDSATWADGPTTAGGHLAMTSLGFGASGYGIGSAAARGMPLLTA